MNPGLRTVIVTGAYGAIGKAIAKAVAEEKQFKVIMVGRNKKLLEQTAGEVRENTGNQEVLAEAADLSDKESVFALAHRVKGPLYALVNNAASCPRMRKETKSGMEVQFATNIMGYVWMTEAFTPHLVSVAPSRIVNVASYYAGDLDLSDLEFRKRRYDNIRAYRQSKQANRMLTVAYAEKLAPLKITVNACHPGDVNSKLSNDLGFGGSETPAQGADTPAWLVISPELEKVTGKYFADRKEVNCEFSNEKDAIRKLFLITASI